ncbi:MAG: carbohydrate porin [Woeseia sp.]
MTKKKLRLLPLAFTGVVLCAPQMAQAGDLTIKGGLTAVYQQELRSNDDDASLSGDLFLTYPTNDGNWFLYIEGATGTDADSVFNLYPEVNGDANSVLDRNGGSHLQVSELYYQFKLGERSRLLLGQIDTSAQIDRSRISNDENTQFLGVSFVNNPTIGFPDYALGILYRQLAYERKPEVTLILSSSDGIADNPGRSYSELIDITGAGKGVFASASARWFRGPVEYGGGVWMRSDKHPRFDDMSRTGRNHGAYGVYGITFGEHTLNFRGGFANDKVTQAARFAGVSYELRQPQGTFGFGAARIFESNRARTASSGDTDHIEAWYRLPLIADHLHVTADLQFVSNPGFYVSPSPAEANALVAGLRFDYVY